MTSLKEEPLNSPSPTRPTTSALTREQQVILVQHWNTHHRTSMAFENYMTFWNVLDPNLFDATDPQPTMPNSNVQAENVKETREFTSWVPNAPYAF